jgi:cyclopropane fatty-acyl-phospholipid synthase-like methyltransferase
MDLSKMTKVAQFEPTTQSALLERPLTWLRTRKILPWICGKIVLDFGCGSHFTTLKSIRHRIKKGIGYDIVFADKPALKVENNLTILGNLTDFNERVDVCTSLACFEHLEKRVFQTELRKLHQLVSDEGCIIGTVPTPRAKPVLEFLSYKLGLIDKSQILDHKVYYDFDLLRKTIAGTGWTVDQYRTFQFGMNSFFILKKADTL